jgi:tetratricopeptide (TPR) repeat protein
VTVSYLAEQPSLARKVVIKLLERPANDPQFTTRFMQAVRSAAQLNHPSLVPIYEMQVLDDALMLVEKYIEGGSLSDRLSQPVLPSELEQLLNTLAQTIDELHARALTHGGLTPNNILLGAHGQPLLDDWAIARLLDATPHASARADPFVAYVAPEQRVGQSATPAADMYALGVLTEQLASGRALVGAHESSPAIKLLSSDAQKILRAVLSPQPSQRPSSAVALAQAVLRSPQAVADQLPPPRGASLAQTVLNQIQQGPPIVKWALGGAMVVIALVLGIVAANWLSPAPAPSATVSAPDTSCKQFTPLKLTQGEQYARIGKLTEARQAYQEVVTCEPNHERAVSGLKYLDDLEKLPGWFAACTAALDKQDYETAIKECTRVQNVNAAQPGLGEKLYNAYMGQGRKSVSSAKVAAAVPAFEAALKLRPNDAAASLELQRANLFVSGLSAYDSKRWKEAIAKFSELYTAKPDYQPNLPALLFNSDYQAADEVWQLRKCAGVAEAISLLEPATKLKGIDVGAAENKLNEMREACATPTPEPTATPTRPPPTSTPVRYCFVAEVVGQADRPGGVIHIEGRVIDRNGRGIAGMVVAVRPKAGGPTVYAQSAPPNGNYNYHGLQGAAEWLITLRDFEARETLVTFTKEGMVVLVNVTEKPCPR